MSSYGKSNSFGAMWQSSSTSAAVIRARLADLAPHLTPYRYAFNNPIRYHDPTGLFEVARDGGEKDPPVKNIGCPANNCPKPPRPPLQAAGNPNPSMNQLQLQQQVQQGIWQDRQSIQLGFNKDKNNVLNNRNLVPNKMGCLDCPSPKNYDYKNREIFKSPTGHDYIFYDNSWHPIRNDNLTITVFDGEYKTVEIDRVKMFEAEYIYKLQMKSGLINAFELGTVTAIGEKILKRSLGQFSLPAFIGRFAESSKAAVDELFERMRLYDGGVDTKKSSK